MVHGPASMYSNRTLLHCTADDCSPAVTLSQPWLITSIMGIDGIDGINR